MPVCFLHLWKGLILGGASTEHTCCWLRLKASLLAPSHSSYEQTDMERSSSCVHAGEFLKFPICSLRKPSQSCFLGEKVMLCGNTLPQADQGGHGMLQCIHCLTKELWVEMPCFSAYPPWLSRSLYLSSIFFLFYVNMGTHFYSISKSFLLGISSSCAFLDKFSSPASLSSLRFLMELHGLVWNITSSGRCTARAGSTGKERDTKACCCLTLSRTYWNTACAGAKVKEVRPHLSTGIWVCPVSQSNGNVEALGLAVSISPYMKYVCLL